jgi:hypothetical protein
MGRLVAKDLEMSQWVARSWLVVALLVGSWGVVACGDDPVPPQPPPNTGVGGEAGGSDAVGASGEQGVENTAGSPAVTPGDLVCSTDDDCTSNAEPVCDQVLGCVACQYDWDCPANHRCRDNECFAKRPCTAGSDCASDAEHPVCDGVQQVCVGCRENGDCADGERCQANECVAFQACTNSRDCSGGTVCDRSVGACVACVVDGDCGDGNACVKNACVPRCSSDKDCLGIGLLCDLQVARCVECLNHTDCPTQYFCAGGSCALDVCETGQTRCESVQQLATCSAVGDTFTSSTCAGNTSCVEQDLAASCVPRLCAPGGIACSDDHAALVHCSADGLSIADTEPCLEGTACSQGACVPVLCAPSAFRCAGQTLYQCNESGTQESQVQYCSGNFGSVCDAEAGTCKARLCYPGEPSCNGNTISVCAEDGLSYEPNGTDCTATQQACYLAECRDVVCTTDYVCEGATLRRCTDNGTRLATVKDCGSPALCDAAGAKCITPTCTPGAFTCDGSVATRCKADGSGYVPNGTDCAHDDLVCDGGGCLPKACTPSQYFCAGGNPQKCGTTGATYAPSDTCTSNEFCAPGSSLCQLDKCTAGGPVCSGNFATTCESDGSGPIAGGTDCSLSQQVCESGACKALVCAPGALTCQGEAVYQCNANGTGTVLYDACSVNEFCDASGETPVCNPDVCSAGSVGCNGEVVSTCGANGGSWGSPGANCATTDQVCTLGGTCAAEELATQGNTVGTLNSSNVTYFSGFRALTSRKLTKLEVYANFPGLQKLTWVVYEKRSGAGAFDLVYQKVTSQTVAAAGFIVSPALDFKLEKGKTYALGVHITGTPQVAYHSSATFLPKASFIAAVFGGTHNPGSTQPATSFTPGAGSLAHLRFTSALP